MPKITFVHDNITVEVDAGSSIQDAVEKSGASLPFGCRMGSCGTCRCLVVEGMENVNALTDEESDLFESLTHLHPNERLACQLVVHGDVKIQA